MKNKFNFVSAIFIFAGILLIILGIFIPVESAVVSPENNLDPMIGKIIIGFLGAYFAFLGGLILLMQHRKVNEVKIEVVAGAIGAYSFGFPAMFALPFVYWLYEIHQKQPLPPDQLTIGIIFTSLGFITTVATSFMIRHYLKTGSNTISWSAQWPKKRSKTEDDNEPTL